MAILLEMAPVASELHVGHEGRAHAELFGERAARHTASHFSDEVNSLNGQLRRWVRFAGHAAASREIRSAFSNHIGSIVLDGPRDQVCRIAAQRLVARMHAARLRPMPTREKERHAVSLDGVPEVKLPIPVGEASLPEPAFIGSGNAHLCPKPLYITVAHCEHLSGRCL